MDKKKIDFLVELKIVQVKNTKNQILDNISKRLVEQEELLDLDYER